MKILVACEYSGIVRDAFAARGHDAWSCDLEPTDIPGQHIQGDALKAIALTNWDMVIAHPPCQYITFAGIRYFNRERYGNKAIEREYQRDQAIQFFKEIYAAPVGKICIENPVGFVNRIIKPAQTIHPYYFGDNHKKRTCLWLKGLPPLIWAKENNLFTPITACPEPQPLSIQIRKPSIHYKGGEIKNRYFTDVHGSGKGMAKLRAKTFPGIAKAMAEQWG